MGNDVKRFVSAEDGCAYFYDKKNGRYRKVCDIRSFDDLPPSVKSQIKAAKLEAAEIMGIPTE